MWTYKPHTERTRAKYWIQVLFCCETAALLNRTTDPPTTEKLLYNLYYCKRPHFISFQFLLTQTHRHRRAPARLQLQLRNMQFHTPFTVTKRPWTHQMPPQCSTDRPEAWGVTHHWVSPWPHDCVKDHRVCLDLHYLSENVNLREQQFVQHRTDTAWMTLQWQLFWIFNMEIPPWPCFEHTHKEIVLMINLVLKKNSKSDINMINIIESMLPHVFFMSFWAGLVVILVSVTSWPDYIFLGGFN